VAAFSSLESLNMKLHAEIGEKEYEVEISREDGRVTARIDGREYELEASEPEPGTNLLKHEGKIYEAFVETGNSPSAAYRVHLKGREYEIELIDPKRLRGSGSGEHSADGFAEIKSAMPGKVVRILVSEGDPIEKGEGVVVVEAMKMQNELKSPKAGTVREIRVSENSTVSGGDVLAVIE
jgi:biotin carboxyl carrier protein